ncbi:MAG: phosphatidylserine/phosphatidylglycerophosphate/cardiolipin synthase family protein [Myxococcota bacterium]
MNGGPLAPARLPAPVEGREPYAEVTVGPHRLSLLKDGFQAFPAMLAAIAHAQHTICLETYILRDDVTGTRFINALIERAQAGVEVLLMFDFWGSDVQEATVARLREAGVKVLVFRPVRFTASLARFVTVFRRRNHRKALVVDGRLGFTGGLNLSDDYAAVEDGGQGWRDTHLGLAGPAAQELERLFLQTWKAQKGPAFDEARFVRPRAAGTGKLRIIGNDFAVDRKGVRRAYLHAFHHATRHIFLTHAYFMPPKKVLKALIHAAQRGVRVALVLAASTDVRLLLYAARGLYPRLLKKGIEVYEWRGRVLHAKTAVVDGRWSTVGSANLDAMSLRHNLEVNAVVTDPIFCQAVERLFLEDLTHCERVTRETVRGYGLLARLLSWLAYRLRHWL